MPAQNKHFSALFSAVLGIGVLLAPIPAIAQSSVDAAFQVWLKSDLWPEARAKGISSKTFNAAFQGVSPNLKLPDLVIPGQKKKVPKKQRQAEFRSPAAYFAPNIIGGVISGGKKRLGKYGSALKSIERQTGVPARIILAIWGRESAFGSAKIPYNAFEVLGTKAFMSTRKDYFREEVIAALQMVDQKGIRISTMRGSWAGALGQPQFMPSSYLAHARDFDGDKVPDIWNSVPDTLGSIGGYLADKGWVAGRDWGFEVSLPQSVSCALEGPDQGRKISEWTRLGINRINGKPFPGNELKGEGYLMLPAGRFGPAFIVTPNFFVIKEYNKSDLYALFVGHAGDRLQYGGSAFTGSWGDVGGMYRSDIAKIQRGLQKIGYDVGGADGLPGFKTRRSIGDWQQKNGLNPTCFPESSLKSRF
ncbi:MAG: lytic murein transglycosylase [Salaquimonas sp.]